MFLKSATLRLLSFKRNLAASRQMVKLTRFLVYEAPYSTGQLLAQLPNTHRDFRRRFCQGSLSCDCSRRPTQYRMVSRGWPGVSRRRRLGFAHKRLVGRRILDERTVASDGDLWRLSWLSSMWKGLLERLIALNVGATHGRGQGSRSLPEIQPSTRASIFR